MANDDTLQNLETFTNFTNIIGIVFNNWTALKISLEHGMAGHPLLAARKVQTLIETTHQALVSGASDWTDLSDILAELMDTQFCIELEDGSSDEVAKHLYHLYQIFNRGALEDLKAAISVLPNRTQIHVGPSDLSTQRQVVAVEQDEDDDEDDAPLEDGWTVVKRR